MFHSGCVVHLAIEHVEMSLLRSLKKMCIYALDTCMSHGNLSACMSGAHSAKFSRPIIPIEQVKWLAFMCADGVR